jgi:hypothetical protein
MIESTITLEATLQSDGETLRLEKKLAIPPGPVTVTVRPTAPRNGPTMLDVLLRIHRDQRQRTQRPMSDEEMAAEIAQMRIDDSEYEERWRETWSQTEANSQLKDSP